ncbi:MAG: hypothetical protein NC089_08190 [Bacteroides sp.]|nr:hypothetical protein [Bacteroides sp.]MCM1549443.1 hypothetical protein [Clostridium sp.]
MKHRVKIIYGAITTLILLAGFLLPGQILHIQDQRQRERVDRYELNDITLNVTSQLFEKLAAVKAGIMLEADYGAEARMREEEVYEQVIVANEMFGTGAIDFAMDAESLLEPVIVQRLVVDEEGDGSFIVWQGHLEDDFNGVDVFIDDATGKMLGITVYAYDAVWDIDQVITHYISDTMQERIRNYYGLADVTLSAEGYVERYGLVDAPSLSAGGVDGVQYGIQYGNGVIVDSHDLDGQADFVFQLVNESGGAYALEWYINEGSYSLNYR